MLLYDMVSKKQLNISNNTYDCIEDFVADFFENFNKTKYTDALIIVFIDTYVNKLSNLKIDIILTKFCNKKIVSELIDIYYNAFNSIEIIKEDHEQILELQDNMIIKKQMVSLILYNIVNNIQIVY